MSVPEEVRTFVRERAGHECEYCRLPQAASILPHQIDHIIASQHMGSDEVANLCLCCIRCNLNKGPNIASLDPVGGGQVVVPLFHPRRERWRDHFALRDTGRLEGLTPQGRATARLLDFSAAERTQLRALLMKQGWRPKE